MNDRKTCKTRDMSFPPEVFTPIKTDSLIDKILAYHEGVHRAMNYMVTGGPGVGKTTLVLDVLSNIQKVDPNMKTLFVSAEMGKIHMFIYTQRFPKFDDIETLYTSDFFESKSVVQEIKNILELGWDVVAFDSLHTLSKIFSEELGISEKKAELYVLTLMGKHNHAENDRKVFTTGVFIQQVTKGGVFVGSNAQAHFIDAMLDLKFENANVFIDERYMVFTKHRVGTAGDKLYYDLSHGGDVLYNYDRFKNSEDLKKQKLLIKKSLKNKMKFGEILGMSGSDNPTENLETEEIKEEQIEIQKN